MARIPSFSSYGKPRITLASGSSEQRMKRANDELLEVQRSEAHLAERRRSTAQLVIRKELGVHAAAGLPIDRSPHLSQTDGYRVIDRQVGCASKLKLRSIRRRSAQYRSAMPSHNCDALRATVQSESSSGSLPAFRQRWFSKGCSTVARKEPGLSIRERIRHERVEERYRIGRLTIP